ncbi:Propanediol diffusion facilitator [Pelotomaculum sp. FP]|uniref:MIP/aquaporin family protein n=1 Tax=Pelotomaculum sp. FP TaxID=261474 RepID=UPI0010658F9C|nr:aquaporin [Pelotomaculum sp. FP]TEB16407.1 Propanediol diffusion facilitator [Pelotomaculum sp. FP]
MDSSLWKKLAGEFIGCWTLGFLGLMCVAVAIVSGGLDLFGVGIAFAFAITFAVYLTGAVGGAHLNPAVTLAFALFGGFPKKDVIPYWIAQVLGWCVGALFLYMIVGGMITAYEAAHNIVRGSIESQITAMIFNCYAPHPAFAALNHWDASVVPTWRAIVSEMFGTMMLVVMVFAFVDPKNPFRPSAGIFALIVGLVVGYLILVTSPQTMAAINPARDLGPRIATWILGWGQVSFPGPASGVGGPWYIWTVGPLLGGVLAGALWKYILLPCIPKQEA